MAFMYEQSEDGFMTVWDPRAEEDCGIASKSPYQMRLGAMRVVP